MPERIIVRNTQSPGDYVVLTAAIRELCRAHPGRFEFMMDVPQQAVFMANPYTKGFHKTQAGVKQIVAQYPAIHQSNHRHGVHFMWGFIEDLNHKLNARAILTEFRPDLHLTPEEKATPPCGMTRPYWVFASGGKKDYTAKWWDSTSWQTVANQMIAKGHRMVQVGGGSHVHPPMRGVIDLVNKTSFRDLMRLIYHADGVMCIVTCLAHIAAGFNKPCVVVAGGREPWWWEAYTADNRLTNMRKGQPTWSPPSGDNFIPHQYLHTIGQLDCCATGGCWKSRIVGNGSVCVKPVTHNGQVIPKCLQMITPEMVVEAAESYYKAGMIGDAPRELILPPMAMPVAPPPPTAEVTVVKGRTAGELKKALDSASTKWLIWMVPEFELPELDKWIESALARMEPNNATLGGLLGWRYRDRIKVWSMEGGMVLMNVALAKQLDLSDQTPDDQLGAAIANTAVQKGARIVGLGDIIRYV